MQRTSRKREAILAAVCASTEHPSAEWVYSLLKPAFPDLSLGTVYRNLTRFREEGKLVLVDVVAGEARFDGRTEEHPHFICDGCGRVTDLPGACGGDAPQMPDGYLVRSRKLVYRGLCPQCRMSAGSANPDNISSFIL